MHYGGAKSWTVVPYKYQKKLEAAISNISPFQCPNILRHKHLIISNEFLRDNEIPFTTVVQHPGEYIITEKGAYHGFAIIFSVYLPIFTSSVSGASNLFATE